MIFVKKVSFKTDILVVGGPKKRSAAYSICLHPTSTLKWPDIRFKRPIPWLKTIHHKLFCFSFDHSSKFALSKTLCISLFSGGGGPFFIEYIILDIILWAINKLLHCKIQKSICFVRSVETILNFVIWKLIFCTVLEDFLLNLSGAFPFCFRFFTTFMMLRRSATSRAASVQPPEPNPQVSTVVYAVLLTICPPNYLSS